MGVWDYISALAMPFFENPIFIYIVVLLLIGTDAYGSMFPTAQAETALNDVTTLDYHCRHPDLLTSYIMSNDFLRDFSACSTIARVTPESSPKGFFGGNLTGLLHGIGLPKETEITSPQLFFVMLFIGIIGWIATHKLS